MYLKCPFMRQAVFAAVLLMLMLQLCLASAGTLTLPEGLTVIGPEAFAGNTSLDEVVVPEGTTRILSRAFAGSSVRRISLPASLTEIADDAFEGCTDVLAVAPEDSYAASYASAHSELIWRHYRALLIGQAYAGTRYALTATINDTAAIQSMLRLMAGTPFSGNITRCTDLTGAEILSQITAAFAGVEEGDVSLFFYSGHGASGGLLIGTDGLTDSENRITPAMLRQALDQIPGIKIVIIDACYSGGVIANSASVSSADSFVSSLISAFSVQTQSVSNSAGKLNDPPYLVLASCSGSELSWENSIYHYGYFTFYLTGGCGYSEPSKAASGTFPADANHDGRFTLNELYSYVHAQLSAMSFNGASQTVQVYPSGSSALIFAK